MWFYAKDGRKAGPVSDGELDSLAARGGIDASTLVWKEGLADWLPLATARPGVKIPNVGQEACSQCGTFHSPDNLVALSGLKICGACKPAVIQHLKEGVRLTGNVTAWRHGKLVVTFNEAVLPNRCIKCNRDTHSPPWAIPMAVGFRLQSKSHIWVHLCEAHRRDWKLKEIVGTVLKFLGLGAWGLSVWLKGGVFGFIGAASAIPGVILIVTATPARLKKSKNSLLWIAKTGPEFRDSLPEWTE